jgi:hypothetical protein
MTKIPARVSDSQPQEKSILSTARDHSRPQNEIAKRRSSENNNRQGSDPEDKSPVQ